MATVGTDEICGTCGCTVVSCDICGAVFCRYEPTTCEHGPDERED